jgi:hypothetical protein
MVAVNLIFNITITMLDLTSDNARPSSDDIFPPRLPWDYLYKEATKIVLASIVLIICLIFFFPVV